MRRRQKQESWVARELRAQSLFGYGFALAAVVLAAGLRFGLQPWLAGRAHYLVFIVAVMGAAVFGGSMPAIVAATLSVLFVALLDGGSTAAPTAIVELLTFAGTSAMVIWLVRLIMRMRFQSARDEGIARRSEQYATRLAENLDLLIDGFRDHALIMYDMHGGVTVWSKGAELLYGWTEEEAIGALGSSFYADAAVAAGRPAADIDRIRGEGGFEEVTIRVHKDGAALPVRVIFTALYDNRERFRGFAEMTRRI